MVASLNAGRARKGNEMGDTVLNLVVIRTVDLDRAEHFYGLLGLRFVRHSHGSGPEHLAAEGGGVVLKSILSQPTAV